MRVSVKVFASDGKGSHKFLLDSDPDQEMRMVSSLIYKLKEQFPGNEFQVIRRGVRKYEVTPIPLGNA